MTKLGGNMTTKELEKEAQAQSDFEELEKEYGVAARWRRKSASVNGAPDWVSRWRWNPEDGLDWPKKGTDVY